jgi:PAS domain S-box-containing protein
MNTDEKLKRSLEELAESNRRFREILETLELISVTLDRNGIVTFCNDFLLRLTGWKRAEVIGAVWFDRFLPKSTGSVNQLGSAAAMKQGFLHIIDAGKIVLHDRYPIKTRTGELREIAWNNTMLRDGSGNIVGTASIGTDITERSREETALRESETRFRELAEHIQEVFWVADPKETQKLYISPAFEEIWGRTCQSAYEQPHMWLEAIRLEDRDRVSRAVKTKQTQGSYDEEYRILRPDGTERWIRDRAFPVRDASGAIKRWVGIAADITDSKLAEAELRTAERQLHTLVGRLHTVQEDEAKRIARELHDDLGQQLTALNMKLGNLELKLPSTTLEQREQFARMHTIVNHTIEVVKKISGELRLAQLDVLGLTAAIDWQLKEFSRRSAIPCRSSRLDEVANLSDVQSTSVFRILQEALTNVVRHAGATEVEVSLEAGSEQLTLTVRDDGRGITAAELNNHKAIGLLGMRERAQLVGGDVTITGGTGTGTTVVVTIPLSQSGAIPV